MTATSHQPASPDPALLAPPALMCPRSLAPFLRRAPIPVLVRACLEWMMVQADLETLFAQVAQAQYTRELTIDAVAGLLLDVACGLHPSAHAALAAQRDHIDISRQAFYAKLGRMELPVSEAIAARFAQLSQAVMTHCQFAGSEPIPGFAARILDGTVLGGRTEHRLAPLRATRAAGLTGHALAVYAPAHRLVRQLVLDEDAYTQERAMLPRVVIGPGEVWIGDRNFCVLGFLFRVQREQAAFVIRWHAQNCPYEEIGPITPAPGSMIGATEQAVRLTDPQSGGRMSARRIVLPLEKRTRSGDAELILMTNLPAMIGADTILAAYRDRWKIETHFQRLTQQLHCEPDGLTMPRAALFAFTMAVVAGNVLALVIAALEAAHGEEAVRELSYFRFVHEVASVWGGMAIAVPEEDWIFVRGADAAGLAAWLCELARHADMAYFRRSKRGPKKPPPKKTDFSEHTHVSNKRVIDQAMHSPINSD